MGWLHSKGVRGDSAQSGVESGCCILNKTQRTHLVSTQAFLEAVCCIHPFLSWTTESVGAPALALQVLDARDPLRYRSEDLESYSVALHPTKGSVLLLNKADLLPAPLRSAWADYFEQQGVEYVFWSAKAGIDSLTAPGES